MNDWPERLCDALPTGARERQEELCIDLKDLQKKANNALNLAMESAQELGHTYIGTEHVVLGLLGEGTGVAASVLNARGMPP